MVLKGVPQFVACTKKGLDELAYFCDMPFACKQPSLHLVWICSASMFYAEVLKSSCFETLLGLWFKAQMCAQLPEKDEDGIE